MFPMMKVKNLFPLINGLFTKINYTFPEDIDITDAQLDMLFISGVGMRLVAPLVISVWNGETDTLTQEELTQLAGYVKAMYKYKWDKLAAILELEYDPIHNYSDTLTETIGEVIETEATTTFNTLVANSETVNNDTVLTDGGRETVTEDNTRTVTDSGTEVRTTEVDTTDTDGGSETETLTKESQDAQNRYGLNSSQAVPTDTADFEGTDVRVTEGGLTKRTRGSNEITIEGGLVKTTVDDFEKVTIGGLTHTTDGEIVTEGEKRKTGTEGIESSSEKDRTRSSSHIGNIGNITTQQLIKEEIKLWHWNFINQILNDVKDFLTIPLYD